MTDRPFEVDLEDNPYAAVAATDPLADVEIDIDGPDARAEPLPDDLEAEAQAELAAALDGVDLDEDDDGPDLQSAAAAERGERSS